MNYRGSAKSWIHTANYETATHKHPGLLNKNVGATVINLYREPQQNLCNELFITLLIRPTDPFIAKSKQLIPSIFSHLSLNEIIKP